MDFYLQKGIVFRFLNDARFSQPTCSLQLGSSAKAPQNFGSEILVKCYNSFVGCVFLLDSIADDLKLWTKERSKELQAGILVFNFPCKIIVELCDVCQGEVEGFYYHSDKKGSLNLCTLCYNDENFATGMYHSDFEKIILANKVRYFKIVLIDAEKTIWKIRRYYHLWKMCSSRHYLEFV